MKDPEAIFAGVAHDLKTPLAVLCGFAELLATRDDEEIRREAPRAILEAAEALSAVVEDFLLAFELDCGARRPDVRPVPLAQLVPGNGSFPTVLADRALLVRALDLLAGDRTNVAVRVEDGTAVITVASSNRRPLELYLVGRIAEVHGGELSEAPAGLCLTLPLAATPA